MNTSIPANLIYEVLKDGNTSLSSRKRIVEKLQHHSDLVPTLLFFAFDTRCKVKVLASVILDDLLQDNPYLLDEHIKTFIEQLSGVEDESVKRLTSKIVVLLLKKRRDLLSDEMEEQLLDQSAIWLTTKTKVATESNAMYIILLLCKKFPVQAQLIAEVIEVRFTEKTPAYQSIARKLLKEINHLK